MKKLPVQLKNRYLHLDNQYKHRYLLFTLSNGKVEDSRVKNWRQVHWEKVLRIELRIKDKSYLFRDAERSGFKGYMNFRSRAYIAQRDEMGNKAGHKEVNIWTVGWTDGTDCFLVDIDFKTGKMIGKRIEPLDKYKNHIHPRLPVYQKYFSSRIMTV